MPLSPPRTVEAPDWSMDDEAPTDADIPLFPEPLSAVPERPRQKTFGSLRHRNFRLFFFGRLISNRGNWLTTVAIVLLALHRTNRGFAVGWCAASTMLNNRARDDPPRWAAPRAGGDHQPDPQRARGDQPTRATPRCSMPRVIPPVVGDDDRFFWEGTQRGELVIQRCASCGRLRHPPTPMCPHCRSLDWDTRPSTGRGTVYSWVVSHHPSDDDTDDRVVVLVELAEGVRLVSNLVGLPWTEVRNDLAVEVFFTDVDGVALPQFRPAAPGASA